MKCPACNRMKGIIREGKIFRCPKCEAIFSDNIYLGESYEYVLPYFVKEEPPPERIRYYDFICLGSAGVERRHGWYDTETKRIVQVG